MAILFFIFDADAESDARFNFFCINDAVFIASKKFDLELIETISNKHR